MGRKIDWSNYDQIIRDNIQYYTTPEFVRQLLPNISSRAVSKRIKKLGLKPKKYKPTKAHKEAISKKLNKLSDDDIIFIKTNRDQLSVKEMAKHLNVDRSTVWRAIWMSNIPLLGEKGKIRAHKQSAEKQKGKIPWNKGIPLSEETKIKIAKKRAQQSGRLSKIQETFYKILDELDISHYKEWEEDKCRFGPWTFDCRITQNNKDFLVEVQGDYIHSLPKNKIKDRAKSTYMKRYFPDMPIKYVWEHEFGSINKIKDKILKWTGARDIEQIDFSFDQIKLKEVEDLRTAEIFISAFHYLDKLVGRIKIGAYLNNKLIAMSVWGAPVRVEIAKRLGYNNLTCLELRRFVIHDSYHKKNFASWFLSRSEKLLPSHIKCLISFADPSIGHSGTIYTATNWTPDGETTPSYYYLSEDNFVMHKKTLYNKARKLHMPESDFVDLYHYTKMPSLPKKRYIKHINP